MPIVETVQGVLNAQALATASPRVMALSVRRRGLHASTSASSARRDGVETRYPRAQVALVAHGAGRLAIDTPWTAIDDPDGLEREAIEGRQLGYTGKAAIHPSQIPTIHRVFTPTADEVALGHAASIEAYEAAIASGTGAINLDGKLIDVPMVARARRVLERAGRTSAVQVPGETRSNVRPGTWNSSDAVRCRVARACVSITK